ncbi:hypothetical protein V8H18_05270 [Lautropia mirabilis]
MLMPLGMVVFLAVMVVVMLLAAVGVDGGDLQDDGFVAGLGKVLLSGGVGEDAAGGQGLQLAGVVGVAEAQLQGAADDVDEEVAFLGAVRLQFLVGGDLDAQDADVVVVVGVRDGLAGGKVDLLGGEDLVDALGLRACALVPWSCLALSLWALAAGGRVARAAVASRVAMGRMAFMVFSLGGCSG